MSGVVIAAAIVGLAAAIAGLLLAIQIREHPWRGSRLGYVVGAIALVTLFSLLALGVLDSLLSRMHVLGIADRGIKDITGLGIGASQDFIKETIERWAAWYGQAQAAYIAPPSVVLRDYLVIDSVLLVPAYVTLLGMVRWRSRWIDPKRPPKMVSDDRTEVFENFSAFVRRFLVPIAIAVLDITENLITEFAIRSPLRELESQVARGQDISTTDISASGWLDALRWITVLKWALLIYFVLGTIPSLVNISRSERARRDRIVVRNALFRLRALIALALIYGLLVVMRLQIPDVIRRWNPWQGILAGIAVTILGVVSWIWARRILVARRGSRWRPTRGVVVAVAVGLVIITVVSGFIGNGPIGLAVPAAALILVALLSGLGPTEPEALTRFVDLPATETEEEESESHPVGSPSAAEATGEEESRVGHTTLPRLLAIAPGLVLGVAALRALLPEAVFNHPNKAALTAWILFLTLVLPIAVAMLLFLILGTKKASQLSDLSSEPSIVLRIIGLVVGIYVYYRVVSAVWSFSQAVSALVIVAAFMTIATVGMGALSAWVEAVPPARGLSALGFQRTPIFAFLLIWILLIGPPLERQGYHDVRVDLLISNTLAPTTIEGALAKWEARNAPPEAEVGVKRPVPMLFVAANGGGIKAATWAAFSLDCVLRGGDGVDSSETRALCEAITPEGVNRTGTVFAVSGVSGGSMGIANFMAHEVETNGEADPGWVRTVLGDDFVSPSIAWQLFVETPRAFLQFSPGMDRAEVMERSWERGWDERGVDERATAAAWGSDQEIASPLQRGLFAMWEEFGERIPLPLLNSTTVEDGCRVIVSPLMTDGTDSIEASQGGRNCTGIGRLDGPMPEDQLFAASRDIRHFLCGSDIRLSSAALASARFPWVSPSGRLPFCEANTGSVHVVDGGYLDNSGGETIAALWEAVRGDIEARNAGLTSSCVVPYLILIDSGYGPTPESKQDDVPELLVPLKGFFAAASSRTIEGRNEAAQEFRRPVLGVDQDDRVATVYLRNQPSGEAPLGWTLDDTSIDALEAQLASNADALSEIQSWFSEADACSA
jgi:hypothetical protein